MTENQFNIIKNLIENADCSQINLIEAQNNDGRLTSAFSENIIINFLKQLFIKNNMNISIKESPIRHWHDITLHLDNKEIIPVNIKITTGDQADNINSKKGMFYALTGLWPDDIKGLHTNSGFNKLLLENYNPNNSKDYYFIVFFKNERTFLFSSLKRLVSLVPNGNNLPFQCKWKNNLVNTNRTTKEQCDYILNTYIDSFIKKASGLDFLLEWREKNG